MDGQHRYQTKNKQKTEGLGKQADALTTMCAIVKTSEYAITPQNVSELKVLNAGDFTLSFEPHKFSLLNIYDLYIIG